MLVGRAILYHHIVHILHDSLKKRGRNTRAMELKCWNVLELVERVHVQSDEVGDTLILDVRETDIQTVPSKCIQTSSNDEHTFESQLRASFNMIEWNPYSCIRYNSAASADSWVRIAK